MIVAVDADEAKLELARRRGATHAVRVGGDASDVVDEVRAISGGGVERSFEVVGTSTTIRQAWDVLRPGGTAVVVGLAPAGVEVSLPAIEFLSEKTITGCYYGSADVHAALGQLAQLVVDGRLSLSDVVTDLIALDEVEDALGRLRRGEGGRSVIVIDEELAGVGA
jgi:Zn-dependent alcohol dehydrogenase